ncbi:MAG: hypothetical protein Q8O61_07645 [Nocardioides sp.]|nr:hypothetical protein [Nocardioides sp.]
MLSAFAAASASADVADLDVAEVDVAEVDVTEPAPPHEEAPKRLSWSTGSPLSRLSRRRKPAEPSTPAPVDAPPAILDPAHDVLAAFAAAKPTPTRQAPAAPAPTEPPARVTLVAARTVPETPPAPQTAPEPPLDPTPAPVVRTVHAPDRPGPSRDLTFKPKRGARRLVGLLLLVALAATAYAGYLAYEAQTVESIVVAAGLGVLALALWAIRAGSSVSRLSVTNGQLEILNASGRFVFDLTSVYMPIEVVGTPGQRKWKVLFVRRSMAPFTVDSSMVDPQEFMAVLREYRPESDAS